MDEDDQMNEPVEDQTKQDDWVQIKTSDGYSFIVQREIAEVSGTLKSMLSADSSFSEALSRTCDVGERAAVVEKVLEYLAFKKQYENAGPREEIPDFQERIPPEVALELLMAADYLEA